MMSDLGFGLVCGVIWGVGWGVWLWVLDWWERDEMRREVRMIRFFVLRVVVRLFGVRVMFGVSRVLRFLFG